MTVQNHEPADTTSEHDTDTTPEPGAEQAAAATTEQTTDEATDTDAPAETAHETTVDTTADDDHAARSGDAEEGERVSQLEREGEVAADFLETLLDIADLDGDLDVDVDGDRAAVAIVDSDEGRVPRKLIGSDGEVLEALQELTRLAVQSATGERSRLMLDVGGHRAALRERLVAKAHEAVASAKQSGERQELEPMTAFERKVVHDAVLEAGLSSESEGTEPNRFVVVLP